MRILLIDIETSPNVAYVWGLFKENIPLARLIDTSYTLCWSAKWLDGDVMYSSKFHDSNENMIKDIHSLLCEADVVVHYNGNKFDIPTLNREFLELGLPPPAPFRSVDLYNTVRNKFRFVSNKMDHVCEKLGLGKKHETDFKMWVECMNDDPKAWTKMINYNIQDVILLEQLFYKLRPWIPNMLNHSVFNDDLVCPNCGSKHYQKRGFYYTDAVKYQRYQCQAKECMSWFRDNKNLGPKPDNKFRRIPV